MNPAERKLKLLLRIVGIVCLPAVVPAVMPHSWLAWAVARAEPGTPVRVLVSYLARATSALVVLLGMLLVIFSTDVRRYAWPIRIVGAGPLAPPVVLVIHGAGLFTRRPGWLFWFITCDVGLAFLLGLAVLILQARAGRPAGEG